MGATVPHGGEGVFAALKRRSVWDIAAGCGLQVGRQGTFGPCPACGSLHRPHDRRLSCGVRPNGAGWHCWSCGATGDQVDLAAWARFGHRGRDLAAHEVPGLLDGIADRPPVEVVEPPRNYPPQPEVLRVLRAAVPVARCIDRRVLRYLDERRLPRSVPAGVLPGWDWPGWQGLTVVAEDKTWWPWGGAFPLAVAGCDLAGVVRSVHGRAVDGRPHKAAWPKGCTSAGLVFADPQVARPALRGGTPPQGVLVVEGAADYLAACAAAPAGLAVIGIGSGAFNSAVPWPAWQVPVWVATDADEAGDRYADRLTLAWPVPQRRVRMELLGPPGAKRRGPDVAEALASGVGMRRLLEAV